MCSVIVAAHNYGEAMRKSETTSPRKWWPTSHAFRPTLDHHNYNDVVSDLGGETAERTQDLGGETAERKHDPKVITKPFQNGPKEIPK